jgi:hypothetical protein
MVNYYFTGLTLTERVFVIYELRDVSTFLLLIEHQACKDQALTTLIK